jgi:mannosyltransferase
VATEETTLPTAFSKWSWAVGLATLLYSGFGIWRPSFWTDEAATISAVRRTFPDLYALLANIDAVHGAYYILMLGWTRLFGYSEVAVRLPSLIAISCAAVLFVELGRKVGGISFGVVAAALLVLLPRTQYVGTDARSYALTLLGAVVATYLLVSMRERPSSVKCIGYATVGLLTVSLSFYCAILVIAHALTVFLDKKLRDQWRPLLLSSIGWVAPALFIGGIAIHQQFQISWIREVGPAFPYEFFFLQFFADGYFLNEGFVVPAPTSGESWTTIVLAIMIWSATVVGAVITRPRFLVLLALPWLLVPPAVVVGGSLITGSDYYLPRYLTFILPAMALLAAAPILALPNILTGEDRYRKLLTYAALVAVFVVCIPSYLGQRTQFGRDPEDDFRFVAQAVKDLSRPGDSFVIDPDNDLMFQAYPDAFSNLADPTLGATATQWKRILSQRFDVISSADRIRQYSVVILVEKTDESEMATALEELGYLEGESRRGPSTKVTRFTHKPFPSS